MKYTLLSFVAQLAIYSSETTTTILGGCSLSEFQCNNGECIPSYKACNRIKDCTDNSDEYMCSTYTPTTTSNRLNELYCDGVVYDLGGIIFQQPAGVCEQDTGSMWRCDTINNLAKVYFENQNCTGDSINTIPFSSFAVQLGITRYSVTCCSGNQCNFGLIRTWHTTKCDDYSTGSSFSDEVKLIGGCADMPKTTYSSCLNGKLTEKIYYNEYYWTESCVGMDYETQITSNGQCDGNNTMEVICGTAEDTCNNSTVGLLFVIIFIAVGCCLFMGVVCICRWYYRIRAKIASKISSKAAEFIAPIINVNVTKSENDASLLAAANNDEPVTMIQNDGSYY